MENIHVFLNGARGVSLVRSLVDAGHEVSSVYAAPETIAADDLSGLPDGTPVESLEDVNTARFVHAMAARNPRLAIIGGFNSIFGKPLIDVAQLGVINLHAGPLPKYRGGSPLNWQIINGESDAGISVIRIDEGIDTGEILAEARFSIGLNDTISDVHERANALFPKLVLEVVERFDRNDTSGRVQDHATACYWHQRNADDGRIYWHEMTARQVHDLIRALDPLYPPAFAFCRGRRVIFRRSQLEGSAVRGVPGRVCYLQGKGPYVICKDHAILVTSHEIEASDSDSLSHGAHLD